MARRAARREDIEFWVNRRGLKGGVSTTGRKIFGHDLEEGRAYESREPIGGG